MRCPICDNGISENHTVELVKYEGIEWEVSSAVISADKQNIPCEFHEKIILDIVAKQRYDRNEKEMDEK